MNYLLITVFLLVALAVPALAAEQQQGEVNLTVPGVFELYYNIGKGDFSFTPTETQILTPGSFLQSNPTPGQLTIASNYNGTGLYVERNDWTPQSHPTSDGEFTLIVRHHSSMGDIQFVTVPDTSVGGTPVQIGDWPNGVANETYTVVYRLLDFSVDDDPDVYHSTVTFTLSTN
jgi:hypothetical protein